MDVSTIAQLLKERGIRPTAQRIGVYGNIAQRTDHPTVEMLYQDMHPTHPSLSKTTVYNTLDMLSQAGLVKVVTINTSEARFDADTSLHGHFQCSSCGNVYDIRLPELQLTASDLAGFEVSTQDVYFTGKCPKCQKKQ